MNKINKNKYYFATMYKGIGVSCQLKVTMDDRYIYFVRDKNGVNAWHCGSLLKTDSRILKIEECKN